MNLFKYTPLVNAVYSLLKITKLQTKNFIIIKLNYTFWRVNLIWTNDNKFEVKDFICLSGEKPIERVIEIAKCYQVLMLNSSTIIREKSVKKNVSER